MQLFEIHRPKCWAEFIGQDKAIRRIRAIVERDGFDRGAFTFTGVSGCGKTSAAFVLADALGVHPCHVNTIVSRSCNLDTLKDIEDEMRYAPMTGWGKLYLIDEADTMSPAAKDYLLGLFERLPAGRIVVCTSNVDVCGFDERLFSRIYRVPFGKPDSRLVEEHVRRIAGTLDFDPPAFNWRRFVQDRHNNIRLCLSDLELEIAEAAIEADAHVPAGSAAAA